MNVRLPILLAAATMLFAATQVSCEFGDDCDYVESPDFQSGVFVDDSVQGDVEVEFAENDDSFTITHQDGTVEVFTRTSRILRYDGSGQQPVSLSEPNETLPF